MVMEALGASSKRWFTEENGRTAVGLPPKTRVGRAGGHARTARHALRQDNERSKGSTPARHDLSRTTNARTQANLAENAQESRKPGVVLVVVLRWSAVEKSRSVASLTILSLPHSSLID